jgi:hypothetical protein
MSTYLLQAPDVGPLQQLEVSCKGGGMTAAWHLAHISVTHPVTQAVTRFDHNEWFDAQHGWTQVRADSSGSGGMLAGGAALLWTAHHKPVLPLSCHP